MFHFDLTHDKWVNCFTTDGDHETYSLIDLFTHSHRLDPILDPSPLTTSSLLRLLMVLLHQVEPKPRTFQDKFPTDLVEKIEKNTKGKFDLFDAKYPFMQIAEPPNGKTTVSSTLMCEIPTGTNINHLRHTYDKDVAICPTCCARAIVRLPSYAVAGGRGGGGAYLLSSINGSPPIYFVPMGRTLFHTLLLNHPLTDPVKGDHPSWDHPSTISPGKGWPDTIGIMEGLTWQPRLVKLFPQEGHGVACTSCGQPSSTVVCEIFYTDSGRGKELEGERVKQWRDPHVAYYKESGKPVVWRSRTYPQQFDPETMELACLREGHQNLVSFAIKRNKAKVKDVIMI